MRVRTTLDLSCIKCDRLPLGPATLRLVKHLENGGTVPPIHVKPNFNGQFDILDGRHRYLAFKLLGRKVISVKYGILECPSCGQCDMKRG